MVKYLIIKLESTKYTPRMNMFIPLRETVRTSVLERIIGLLFSVAADPSALEFTVVDEKHYGHIGEKVEIE